MTTAEVHAHRKVPFGHKIAFGLGMLANQMFPAALGIFMVVLVQDLGFPAWMWGILFFLPRVFDSVTDPIMGFISDNTRSTWGRRKQYVLIGAIVMGISFVAMWQLYREDGITYNFFYFLLWSLVFYTGLTLFSIPYVAMGYEMSDDFHERTSIMAVAQWIGQWAWVIAPWFWVVMYDKSWFENADTATRTLSIWVGVICMLLAMVPALFLPSRSSKDDDHLVPLTLNNIGGGMREILQGFKEALSSAPFRKLCFSTFLIFNAFNTVAAFSFFIVVYHLFGGSTSDAWIWPTLFGSVGALITTFAVIPTVAWMSRKVGKKNAFMVSQGISIIGYVLLWFLMVPGKPWMFMFALPFFSFGIGGLFTLMMSMTADVCDLDELATGKRREGIFGAIYWWMVKFGFAIAGLLSGAIMSVVAFTPAPCWQCGSCATTTSTRSAPPRCMPSLSAASSAPPQGPRKVHRVPAPGWRKGACCCPVSCRRRWLGNRLKRSRRCTTRSSPLACTVCASAPMAKGSVPGISCRRPRWRVASTSSRHTPGGFARLPAPKGTK
ncbi:MAG: MFS transporter [Hydrogenophaga sp.]|nr:MFS transporter [Hydrogenophaga sp.]